MPTYIHRDSLVVVLVQNCDMTCLLFLFHFFYTWTTRITTEIAQRMHKPFVKWILYVSGTTKSEEVNHFLSVTQSENMSNSVTPVRLDSNFERVRDWHLYFSSYSCIWDCHTAQMINPAPLVKIIAWCRERHQAITEININQFLWHHITPLGSSELTVMILVWCFLGCLAPPSHYLNQC